MQNIYTIIIDFFSKSTILFVIFFFPLTCSIKAAIQSQIDSHKEPIISGSWVDTGRQTAEP